MSIITDLRYTANLDKGVSMTPIMPSFLGGDQEAHRFVIDCYRLNNREAVDLSGVGVTAYFVRADGQTIPLTGTTQGNKASVLLPAACYEKTGRFSLVIKLSLGDSISTVFWGEGAVSRSRTDVVIDPDSVIPSLEELLAQIDAMEKATAAANEAAASVEGFKAEINDQVSQLSEDIADSATPIVGTAAGDGIVVLPNSAARPLRSLTIGNVDGAVTVHVTGKNLWGNGNLNVEKNTTVTLAVPLPPGKYVLSAFVTSTDTDADTCRVGFANGNLDGTPVYTNLERNKRASAVVETFGKVERIGFYASTTSGTSSGDTAMFNNVMIEPGEMASDYEPFVDGGSVAVAAAGEVDVSGLRSQYLNTTITNDAGATMEAVFVADTMAYIDELEEKINDKQDTPETEGAGDNNAYPAYFDENIKAAVEKIKDNMAEVGQNGETFVFITDIHWDASERNSPALVNYIYDKTNVQTLICGGDLINEGEHDTMRDDILDVVHQFGSAEHPFITLFGNHDSNKNYTNADMPERWFSENGIYSYMFKQAEKHVTFWNGFNFCVDNPATKTRFVCLNTKENGSFAEYSDLTDILVGTPSGYHVVIVAHWLYNNSVKSASCVNLEQIIDAYNARSSVTISGVQHDYTNAQADIVYMQGGHCHRDINWTTPNGVPVVLTDCDIGGRTKNEEYPYVKGTITEHCFDIVTMNYADKSIKMVRVGRGADRAFTQA